MTKNQKTANILGYGGLIPFVIFSIGSWTDLPGVTQTHSIEILIAYGAIILSFMGAIHWGLAMAHQNENDNEDRSQHLIISILPALTAWLALLMTTRMALVVLLIAFIVLFIYDRAAEKTQRLPAWYLPMRIRLTIVVTLCLAGALLSI